ncbi:alpha/beta hydrolase [Sphingomonas sp. PR090111-T3T-6A]|uniref:alpha/beta hydrolase n=1 Tax=Sphingomonas sp. PR090111-T3T-6A TaxID=685778 RepID=UPI00055CE9BC|nr:alpha/beta hydrolase [Sphingomonas sp. PR090111-T3T-6A]
MRKIAACMLALSLSNVGFAAQGAPWPPSPGHPQIPLWSGPAPDPFTAAAPENMTSDPKELIAGRPLISVNDVSKPTLTVYRPKGANTGAAVLVYPGGGYWLLAIDLEGTEVCDWLTANGVTCILVKYRVPGYDKKEASRTGPYPRSPVALEDAQRAIALTRFHAKEWGIDPHKIGVLGFSAGGHLVAATSTHDRIYRPTDAIDRTSVRPDFGIALYPGHLWVDEDKFKLDANVPVDRRTPPQLIVQSGSDPVDDVKNSLVYYIALQKAGVSAEMHLYPVGGHAFGLRHTDKAITDWPRLALRWMKTIGMIGDGAASAG